MNQVISKIKRKTCKKGIVKEYKLKCPWNMIKIVNLINIIETSYEDEDDNNNNYRSENTKMIRDFIYQCCQN